MICYVSLTFPRGQTPAHPHLSSVGEARWWLFQEQAQLKTMKNWFWKKTDQHAKKKCHGSGFQGKFVSWSGRIWYCKRIISKELSGTAYNSQVLLRGLTWLVWLLVEWLRGNWRHCNRWFAESHFKIKTSPVLKNCCYCSSLHRVQFLWPHGFYPTRLLCPWDFPGKNTGVGCHFLLQRIFPTQGSNPGCLHCRWILYCWAIWDSTM